ncbi:MAG: deoxyribonuclease IV [Firmicutes bacterium]|nr:deoxyribonuclease IV [Bacillota bacterium]
MNNQDIDVSGVKILSQNVKIGAHLPMSGGLEQMVNLANALRLEAVQFFSRSPRGGRVRQFGRAEAQQFQQAVQASSLQTLVVHIPYIVNPASPSEQLYHLAEDLVLEDLNRADQLGAHFLVLHPGAYTTSTREEGQQRLIKLINTVLTRFAGETQLLLENISGKGTEIGGSLEELQVIMEHVPASVGLCLDTCHAFAFGYDLSSPEGFDEFSAQLEQTVGWSRVRLVHANDSQGQLGSRVDRHAHIGEGMIGAEGFTRLLHHPLLRKLPFILETPFEGVPADIQRLRELSEG